MTEFTPGDDWGKEREQYLALLEKKVAEARQRLSYWEARLREARQNAPEKKLRVHKFIEQYLRDNGGSKTRAEILAAVMKSAHIPKRDPERAVNLSIDMCLKSNSLVEEGDQIRLPDLGHK